MAIITNKWSIWAIDEYVNHIIGNNAGSPNHQYTNNVRRKLSIPNLGYRKAVNRKLRTIESLPFIPSSVIIYSFNLVVESTWMKTTFGGRYRHDKNKRRIFLEDSGDQITFALYHSGHA